MKILMNPIHGVEYVEEILRIYPITCPYLLIFCKETSPIIPRIAQFMDVIKEWRKVKICWVDGGHDVHLTNPDLVAPIIAEFLLELESKI